MRRLLLLLACLFATAFFLTPIRSFGSATDLSPAVSDISQKFAEKFCKSIAKGMTSEESGASAAAQLSPQLAQGFFLTPVMNELMSSPREDLSASLSNNIFDKCGKNFTGTKEELDNYLTQLASKIPSKSKGLNLPQIRQKESLRQ
ncbi:hypothetical protein [Prochlorococcus sp. MIT 1307]|uniref:hypothetical protein n=1 Tax=Prochlorococcus sp. MIT 1307 TaxID=3096219 RepID=UPI002A75C544|nr:hypothetical protein [Prochlorococcus sp. MIT 1307]